MNTNIKLNPRVAAIFGALIADSAALGLHWIYDPDRIANIESKNGLVFLSPNPDNYYETKGYFAHKNKSAGESSSYGETCLLMLKHFAKHTTFNRVEYQTEYRAYFGPGGSYIGYIDTSTRLTLQTLLSLAPKNFPPISGADDDQGAALAMIPVLVATHQGTLEALTKHVEAVVRITNNNEVAVSAAQCSAAALFGVLNGTPMAQALTNALPFAGKTLKPILEQALSIKTLDSIETGKRFGSACHVTEGLPLVFHIAQHTQNYSKAIKENIRAGGDSCSRAIMLGAIIAAFQAKQEDQASSIPLTWLSRYRKLAIATEACSALKT